MTPLTKEALIKLGFVNINEGTLENEGCLNKTIFEDDYHRTDLVIFDPSENKKPDRAMVDSIDMIDGLCVSSTSITSYDILYIEQVEDIYNMLCK